MFMIYKIYILLHSIIYRKETQLKLFCIFNIQPTTKTIYLYIIYNNKYILYISWKHKTKEQNKKKTPNKNFSIVVVVVGKRKSRNNKEREEKKVEYFGAIDFTRFS